MKSWTIQIRAVLALSAVLCGALSRPATADLSPCHPADASPDVLEIYLDDPQYTESAFRSDAELRAFMNLLFFLLDERKERQFTDLPVKYRLCSNRRPNFDGSDFNKNRVDALYWNGVLVEIWSTLIARQVGKGTIDRKAIVSFVLVPVRMSGLAGETEHDGFYRVQYPPMGSKPTTDFLDLFRDSIDIETSATLALGVRYARKRQFDAAQKNLCKAEIMIRLTLEKSPSPRLEDLMSYVQEIAAENAERARLNPAYGGNLKRDKESALCPKE